MRLSLFRIPLPNLNSGPVFFDSSSSSAYQAAVSTYNWLHTFLGTNRGLIVNVSIFAIGTVTSIDVDGSAMTFVRSDTNGVYRNEIWKLENPGSGTRTITVNLSGSLTSIASASSWTGVNQTNMVEANNGANGSGTDASVNVTTASNNTYVVAGVSTQDTSITATSPLRQRINNTGALGTGSIGDSVFKVTAGSVTTTWTDIAALQSWAIGAVALKPFGGGALLVIQSASHSHLADNIVLIQHNILSVQDALHAHTADNLSLTQHNILTISDALHEHSADNLVLFQHYILAVQNALHGHSADNLVLTQHNVLTVQDASHGHSADNLIVIFHPPGGVGLIIQDALHGHSVDNLVLTQHNILLIQDALHGHAADNIFLSPKYLLIIQDAAHGHSSDLLLLTQHNILSIQGALHLTTSDLVNLVQHNILFIDDTGHLHYADNLGSLESASKRNWRAIFLPEENPGWNPTLW